LWQFHPKVARKFEEHTPKGAKLPLRIGSRIRKRRRRLKARHKR